MFYHVYMIGLEICTQHSKLELWLNGTEPEPPPL